MKLPAKQQIIEALPVSHLSYSSIKSYCQDQQSFYKGYILGQRDDFETKPSFVIWSAVHAGIEHYWIHQWHLNAGHDVPTMTNEDFISVATSQANHAFNVAEKNWTMVWWVTQDREGSLETIKETLESYFSNPPKYKPLYTEIDDIVEFTDFSWEDMPVPIKTKIDMIAEDEEGNIVIVDHKTTSAGYEKEATDIAPDFDLQAGAYFIWCMSITWKQPKRMIFDQIVKGKQNVFKGLLQKDLRELCDKHGIAYEKFTKNEELKQKLLDAKVMPIPETILKYEIDFTKNMEPVKAFIYLYKQVVLDLYYKSINKNPFIVNPFKQFWADVGYKWFLEQMNTQGK